LGSERRRRGGLGLLLVPIQRKEESSNIYIWLVKWNIFNNRSFIFTSRDATQDDKFLFNALQIYV